LTITLFHTNDMHDSRQALERLAGLARPADSVLVDVGDSLKGSNTRWYWHEPVVEQMNSLAYQVQAMGNREFHYLRRVLAHRQQRRHFPILAANLEDLRQPGDQWWQRTAVVTVGDYRIGFTGATPVQYDEHSPWQRIFGFRFHAPETVLPDVIRQLRRDCHVVVLLSHLGYSEDQRLAPLLGPVDIIVGGHSHTVLQEPTWCQGVPIVQTGSHGRFLGETTLRLSAAGALEGLDYRLIPCRT
jgi:2',3'-cyclic-nucleotide 2'-phosphodiesterase (5'-nucleotidase family)